jgi:hypothetical protein
MRALTSPNLLPYLCAVIVSGLSSTAQTPVATATNAQRLVQRANELAEGRMRGKLEIWTDHSTWEKAWVVHTPHFAVRTTRSHGFGLDIATGLEAMLKNFQSTLATDFVPEQPMVVQIYPDVAAYNAFGTTNGDAHSSFYGSFYAPRHAEKPVAVAWDDNLTLLRMQITHSVLHQYIGALHPNAPAANWVHEGLAAYFSIYWDYGWGLGEFERLGKAGSLVPLRQLFTDGLPAYDHAHLIELGMLFYYLLRYREDTRSVDATDAPFRDCVNAILLGRDLPAPFAKVLADPTALDQEFRAYTFPR